MNLLVTGGLGFIGSHTVIELIKSNHTPIIADNLANSKVEVLDKIRKITGVTPIFYQIDVTDEKKIEEIFLSNIIDGIIHFAGFKAVNESLSAPLKYYYNNILSTINICKMCKKYDIKKVIFSSSATVYGAQSSPLKEEMEFGKMTNPYGASKAMSERILSDLAYSEEDLSISLLRYFNPIGAHESGLLGEDPNNLPNNLMPFITKVASGKLKKLKIFGDDYNTVDGTGVRDYIHVVDLAKGHVKAIESSNSGVNIYNLGTGKGTSVLELVNTFMKVNNVEIKYEIVERRSGDVDKSFADVSKAETELGWKAQLGIEDMVRDSWKFEKEI